MVNITGDKQYAAISRERLGEGTKTNIYGTSGMLINPFFRQRVA